MKYIAECVECGEKYDLEEKDDVVQLEKCPKCDNDVINLELSS